MSDYAPAILSALIAELLETHAPSILAADAVCRRAAGNPCLARAQRHLAEWLADLEHGDRDEALAPDRLAAALRALLVRALSRGAVEVGSHPRHSGPVMVLAAEDLAVLEIAREIAVTRDAIAGSTVADDYHEHREALIDKVLDMASSEHRARR